MTKSAVIFGGGNIGRGFIGQLFCESGYEVTFVDVDKELIASMNEKRSYHLQTVSNEGVKDYTIGPVKAIDSNDREAVANAVAAAEICATSLGANVLKFVAPNIAAGLAKRAAANAGPINFIICENLHGAAAFMRDLVSKSITPDAEEYFRNSTGFVNTVIGRMVPAPTPEMRKEDVTLIRVEPYKELPVDINGFVGKIPEISAMKPYDNFDVFSARKLYVHNCGHALMAYVGYQRGYKMGYEAIGDPEIRAFMLAGLRESVDGICAEYKADANWLYTHVDDLLKRFENKMLGDTVFRLGRDPLRKLAAEDRLVGAANLACKCGLKPVHLAWGIAAALFFDPEDDKSAQQLQEPLKAKGPEATIAQVSGIQPGSVLSGLVLDAFSRLSANRRALPQA